MPGDDRTAELEAAFEAILLRYGRLLRGTIVRRCPKHLGLQFDDIEQEARLRLWRALQSATGISHPASYILKAASSATIDAVRRFVARREEQFALEQDGESAGSAAPQRSSAPIGEQRVLLREALSTLSHLPADQRRAVGLHLRGFTPLEIANLLEWSEPKARSAVYRGLAALRARLDHPEGSGA